MVIAIICVLRVRTRATVGVTGYPHGIAATPDGRYVVVVNILDKNLTVIDTSALKGVTTIPGERFPNDALIIR